MTEFKQRLEDIFVNFDEEKAYELCRELHDFEAQGGDLPTEEDDLWADLTLVLLYP